MRSKPGHRSELSRLLSESAFAARAGAHKQTFRGCGERAVVAPPPRTRGAPLPTATRPAAKVARRDHARGLERIRGQSGPSIGPHHRCAA